MAVVSKTSFVSSTPSSRAAKGKLIRVEIEPGRLVKMHEEDAISAGHIKRKATPQNKMMTPPENKATPVPVAKIDAVDFTTISGIGAASARAILANGISTFEQLKASDCDFLGTRAKEAIEAWKAQ